VYRAREGLLKVSQPLPGGHPFLRLAWAHCLRPLSQPHVPTADQADLIGFLQGLPEGRKRRGICYPQWFLLLVAILGILSGCSSVKDLERFAARHHGALNAVLGLDRKGSPTDSTLLYLFERVDLAELFSMLRSWMLERVASEGREITQLV
jgi:hypothetical protein